MTTLYKPVLIESAEQAEALPIGTIAYVYCVIGERMDPRWGTFVKESDGRWSAGGFSHDYFADADMIDAEALVPVEAEEETRDHPGIMYPTSPPRYPQQSRLVTPWEEV